jgi:hypothetical protein
VTFLLAAIGILLLIVCPPAAFVFAIFLIVLWVAVEIAGHRRHPAEGSSPSADLPAGIRRLDPYPDDRGPVITGPDHPLAAIGGVPRKEER